MRLYLEITTSRYRNEVQTAIKSTDLQKIKQLVAPASDMESFSISKSRPPILSYENLFKQIEIT